jgi:hypothetical protein
MTNKCQKYLLCEFKYVLTRVIYIHSRMRMYAQTTETHTHGNRETLVQERSFWIPHSTYYDSHNYYSVTVTVTVIDSRYLPL